VFLNLKLLSVLLFVTSSVQLIQRVPYQGSSGWAWRLQHWRANYSNCDLVLMAKEETVLQGMIDKLIEIGRCYGMEMNVEKTKVMRISSQPSPVTIMIDQKQLENVEMF